VEGKITVNETQFMNKPVRVFTEGDKKPMQYPLHDVKGYQLGTGYYALKEVHGGMRPGKQYAFMKRHTPEGSRIQLFEHTEKVFAAANKQTSTIRYETLYYLQLPSDSIDVVWSLNSERFVPGFEKKMSRLVWDCPELAQKIEQKQPGYFYAQVTLLPEKRADVLLRIIDEYNRCGH